MLDHVFDVFFFHKLVSFIDFLFLKGIIDFLIRLIFSVFFLSIVKVEFFPINWKFGFDTVKLIFNIIVREN